MCLHHGVHSYILRIYDKGFHHRNGGFLGPDSRDTETGLFKWSDQLDGDASPLVNAIIDRIAHDSYHINITSIDEEHDISMRKVYSLDKTLRE